LNKSGWIKHIRAESVIGVIGLSAFIVYFNTIFAYYSHIPFWIATFIDAFLAFIFLKFQERFRWLSVIFFLCCVGIPLFLGLGREASLIPIKISGLVFVWFLFLFTLYKPFWRFIRGESKKNDKDNAVYKIVVPAYLPNGYEEEERKLYKHKGHNVMELNYCKSVSGNISITQSEVPILKDIQIDRKSVYSEKIKGIDITIESEEFGFQGKYASQANNISFKWATWNLDGWYFELIAEELSLEDTRKIISSMIH
jgi:hypothetical protein